MEALLVFLIKTVGSGVIGHYLKKQLENVDKQLPALFEKGTKEEIENYIEQKGLSSQVADIASSTLQNSFIIPTLPAEKAGFQDRAELFANVIRFGFEFSYKMRG